jgi:hypothetical protein
MQSKSKIGYGDIFIVNPLHIPWLDIERLTPAERKKLHKPDGVFCMGIFFLLFIVVGAIVFLATVYQVYSQFQLQFNSDITRGEYLSSYIDNDEDGDSYYVLYTYVVNDKRYEGRDNVSEEFYNRADNGEPYRVTYAKVDPTIASLEGTNWGFVIFMVLFTVAWNGFIWAMFLGTRHTAIREKQLARDGILINGKLTKMTTSTDSDGDDGINVEYRFHSPKTGHLIEGKTWQKRDDFKSEILPETPLNIKIVYLHDKNYKVI